MLKKLYFTLLAAALPLAGGEFDLSHGDFEKKEKNDNAFEHWTVEGRQVKITGKIFPGKKKNEKEISLFAEIFPPENGKWSGISQTVEFKRTAEPVSLEIVMKVRGRELASGEVLAAAGTKDGKKILMEESVLLFSGSFPWTEKKAQFTVPAGAEFLHISIRNYDTGVLSVDDIAISVTKKK